MADSIQQRAETVRQIATDQMFASGYRMNEAKRAAIDEVEKAFLERGLQEVGGTVAELARRCDMNRSHLQMLLKKHGLGSEVSVSDLERPNWPRSSQVLDDVQPAVGL